MRKTYIKPCMEQVTVRTEAMIAVSGSITGNNGAIKYGGVDADGEKDPTVKESTFLWDE